MRESTADIARLNRLLEESYSRAGKHLLDVHEKRWRMTAEEICEELQGVCVLNLATVSGTGTPMVAPVDGLFFRGEFWFSSSHDAFRFRHIRRDSRVSAAYTVGEKVSMIVHGIANEVNVGSGDHGELHQYCRDIYGPTYDSWGNWGDHPFARIEARRFYAIRIKLDERSS